MEDKFLEQSRRSTSSDKTRMRPKRVRESETTIFFENERDTGNGLPAIIVYKKKIQKNVQCKVYIECTSCVESETKKNLLDDHMSSARLSDTHRALLLRRVALFLRGIVVGIGGKSSISAVIRSCIGTTRNVTIRIFPKRDRLDNNRRETRTRNTNIQTGMIPPGGMTHGSALS